MKIFSIESDNSFHEFSEFAFHKEHQEKVLEIWLENNPGNIVEDGKLLIIGRQVSINLGFYIDLLAIDKQGNLVVIELKRDRTPRDTLAQVLEYASAVEMLQIIQLEEIFQRYLQDVALNLAEYHRTYFDLSSDEAVVFNSDQRIVIVAQKISPEIRQTATYLQMKGFQISCLEFRLFKSESGQRLLSTNFVVSNDTRKISKFSSGSLPAISEKAFTDSVDSNGSEIFSQLLQWAKNNALPIHWGVKGFSLNVDISGNHVAFCFGYPPHSVYQQSIYTVLVGRGGLIKTNIPPQQIDDLVSEALASGLFKKAGRELKFSINRPINANEIEFVLNWFGKLVALIKKYGLIFIGN